MFLRNEQVYLRELVSIEPGSSISFDHTFKVAANIGFVRRDGKWVPQYDSPFIVMNENSKILTWQLTMWHKVFADRGITQRLETASKVYQHSVHR